MPTHLFGGKKEKSPILIETPMHWGENILNLTEISCRSEKLFSLTDLIDYPEGVIGNKTSKEQREMNGYGKPLLVE